jgi:hypothetical protein
LRCLLVGDRGKQRLFTLLHPIPVDGYLTYPGACVDYNSCHLMNSKRSVVLGLSLVFCALFAATAQAQNAPSGDTPATPKAQSNRIRIEVVGGDADAPVENASVYLKYVEERKMRKDKKIELNVKTNREGVAHIPDAPLGKVLVQVIAEGWKSYGKWIEITDGKQIIKVKLEKPPRWY